MIRESCIEHNAKARSVIIKSDYLEVCEGDHCGAALLSLIEFWANGAITNNKKPPAKVRLGQFKAADLHWWLLGFYSTKRIMERIEKLRQRGFIEFEESANHKERTYWAHINVIQSALSSRHLSPDKCLETFVSRHLSEQNPVTPDKCLDKDESVQTNVSTSIFSNSSFLSNYNLVAPPEPGAPPTQERVCVELKEVAKEDKLVVEPENNQQYPLATKQDSISTQVNKTHSGENQNSAALCDNSIFVGHGNIAPDGKARTFNQITGKWASVFSDAWMNGCNPDREFKVWVCNRAASEGKPYSLSNAAGEIRNNYQRAGDLWEEYQDELARSRQVEQLREDVKPEPKPEKQALIRPNNQFHCYRALIQTGEGTILSGKRLKAIAWAEQQPNVVVIRDEQNNVIDIEEF